MNLAESLISFAKDINKPLGKLILNKSKLLQKGALSNYGKTPNPKNVISGNLKGSILGEYEKYNDGWGLVLSASAINTRNNYDYASIQEWGSKPGNPRKIREGRFLSESWQDIIGETTSISDDGASQFQINNNLENEILETMLKVW